MGGALLWYQGATVGETIAGTIGGALLMGIYLYNCKIDPVLNEERAVRYREWERTHYAEWLKGHPRPIRPTSPALRDWRPTYDETEQMVHGALADSQVGAL